MSKVQNLEVFTQHLEIFIVISVRLDAVYFAEN